jgi:uncharacterized protein YukE
MTKKNSGKAEQILRDLGRAIDELIQKAKKSEGKSKEEFQKRIEELKRNRQTLERDFKQFREQHADDFEKFEKSVQKAADEVKETINRVFKTSKDK